ncbi:hypothetical protein ACIQPT_32750 [Streptomyces sp. NPDC091289]|uniref:hypothetical protein n=1 Tax=Streptomyces sp. NPDC091289 TaxID=3365989 RepID=UPI00380E034C
MDATVAGLVGALGGAVLGATGAWGAALIAFRAARYQADRQADAQHQQWLRQIRRETYASLITLARRIYSRLGTTVSIEEDDKELDQILQLVRLESPDHLGEAALELSVTLNGIFFLQKHGHSVDSIERIEFLRQLNEFAKLCRESLADI